MTHTIQEMNIEMLYNDKLSAEEQVACEEKIAATIFDYASEGEIDEELAGELGRKILKEILLRFRQDLFV